MSDAIEHALRDDAAYWLAEYERVSRAREQEYETAQNERWKMADDYAALMREMYRVIYDDKLRDEYRVLLARGERIDDILHPRNDETASVL